MSMPDPLDPFAPAPAPELDPFAPEPEPLDAAPLARDGTPNAPTGPAPEPGDPAPTPPAINPPRGIPGHNPAVPVGPLQYTPDGRLLSIHGKPIGRPRTRLPKAPPFDPAQPLTNARYEQMVKLRIDGKTQTETYHLTADRQIKTRTAASRASFIFSQPQVRKRLKWLRVHARNPPKPTTAAGKEENKGNRAPESMSDDDTPVDRETIARKVSLAVRRAKTSMEITQASKLAIDLLQLGNGDQDTPTTTPAAIVEHICTLAGMAPAARAQELGGLIALVRHVSEALDVPLPEVAQACMDAHTRNA